MTTKRKVDWTVVGVWVCVAVGCGSLWCWAWWLLITRVLGGAS